MQFSSTKSISTDVVLLKITCLAWFIAKIMSFKLWTADRIFPVIPTFDFISVSNDVHLFLYIVSLFGFGIIFVVPNKKIILAVLIFEILACLLYAMATVGISVFIDIILFSICERPKTVSVIIFLFNRMYLYF
jgi:hypothetical protein